LISNWQHRQLNVLSQMHRYQQHVYVHSKNREQ